VPSEDGGGIERIIEAILSADSWDQVDAPWDTTNVKLLEGKTLRINSITRRPSSFKGGLGIFLVVNATDIGTGEAMVITTGSVNVVAQLVRLYMLESLPVFVKWIVADRPTENGYYPHHLEIVGRDTKPVVIGEVVTDDPPKAAKPDVAAKAAAAAATLTGQPVPF
jgi:hypothetical protein